MPAPRPLGTDFRVNNTLSAGAQQNASVTALTTGGFVIAWESANSDGAGSGIRAQLYDSLYNAVGGEISVNTSTANNQTSASVAATPGGGFFISWVDLGPFNVDNELRGQAFNSSGNKVGSEVHINTTTTNDQWLPDNAALANGNVVVVWTDNAGTSGNIRAQILNGAGQPVGGELLVTGAANFQGHPAVAGLAGGGYVVIWSDSSLTDPGGRMVAGHVANGARGQIFDDVGNPVAGGSFVVTTLMSGIVEDSANNPIAVTGLSGGGYVVAWKQLEPSPSNFFDIHAKVYNSAGALVHDDFLVNTTTADSQHQPAVTRLADGGFVITWSDNTVQDEVKGQRFDAAGNRNGAEFNVNSTGAGSQSTSDGALLSDGRFVVTFTSDDAGNNDIRAHLFNPLTGADDHNGDGKSDLLLLNDTSHGVAIWQMNGAQVVASPQIGTVNAAAGWHYQDKGDFNGDGKTDLLMLNDTSHGVAIWQMNGTQVAASPQVGTINAAGGWHYQGTGDFNGDGKTDLLMLNDTSHGVAIWQMNGTQVTASPQVGTINAAGGWHYQSAGDFNGDGKTDLLMLNDSTQGVAIWQMDGTQVTASPQVGTITSGWHFADTGDFNGDGKTDLLMLNDTTHGVAIWQMDGTQVTASPQVGTINAAAGWHFQNIGDFNGDGKSDLLFLNDTTHGVAVWQMNGTQVSASPQVGTINTAGGWHYDGLRDFNGDGKTDLLFENDTTHGVAVWMMDGTQVTASPQIGTVAADWHLVV